jgi:hypothetical protein
MTYEQHSTWTNFLLQSLQREAPPGYSKATLHQLMLCDKAAFSKLASSMPTVRPRDDGTFQLGERLLELRNDPTITLYLAPLARPSNAASASQRPAPYTTSAPSRPSGANAGGGKVLESPFALHTIWADVTMHVTENVAQRDGTFVQSRSVCSPTALAITQRRHLDGA